MFCHKFYLLFLMLIWNHYIWEYSGSRQTVTKFHIRWLLGFFVVCCGKFWWTLLQDQSIFTTKNCVHMYNAWWYSYIVIYIHSITWTLRLPFGPLKNGPNIEAISSIWNIEEMCMWPLMKVFVVVNYRPLYLIGCQYKILFCIICPVT